ncbi:MAG: ChaN family lipoprotein [Rhodospirillales bacterium]|nr:ChaN family lipoprotein [Rhodospirillales bacterium]
MAVTNRRRMVAALLACCAVLMAPSATAQTVTSPYGFPWQETIARDHPLVGRAWSATDGSFLDPASLTAKLARTDFLLLGEVHDNADAHALQGWAISRRAEVQGKFGVVFEHIRTDQQEALVRLDEFDRTARRIATANDLFRFLDWQNGGWPSETKFGGLFNAVFNPRLPIYPANPPRQQVRAVARGEEGALPARERARILLDASWDKPLADALYNELKGSHCGAMPRIGRSSHEHRPALSRRRLRRRHAHCRQGPRRCHPRRWQRSCPHRPRRALVSAPARARKKHHCRHDVGGRGRPDRRGRLCAPRARWQARRRFRHFHTARRASRPLRGPASAQPAQAIERGLALRN